MRERAFVGRRMRRGGITNCVISAAGTDETIHDTLAVKDHVFYGLCQSMWLVSFVPAEDITQLLIPL